MLKLLKQFKKQTEHVSDLTKLIINKINQQAQYQPLLNATYKLTGEQLSYKNININSLKLFAIDRYPDLNNRTFKLCLNDALNHYKESYNVKVHKNQIYFITKQLFAELA